MITTSQQIKKILVDGHVHIHSCFDLMRLLDSALENFDRAAKLSSEKYLAVLLIADIGDRTWLRNYNSRTPNTSFSSSPDTGNRWLLTQTKEPFSFKARNHNGQTIFLILGRQVVTQEGIEVLSLMTEKDVPDFLPLEATIQFILELRALPVIPWGVGKWFGRRGSLVHKLTEVSQRSQIFLGDNGGRPIFWSQPSHFKQAHVKGIRVLPGTDPLPLSKEYRRPGSFGFELMAFLDENYPGGSLRRTLLNSSYSIHHYGQLETPLRFFFNQWMLRYGKLVKMLT